MGRKSSSRSRISSRSSYIPKRFGQGVVKKASSVVSKSTKVLKEAAAFGEAGKEIVAGLPGTIVSGLTGGGWLYPGSHYIGPGNPIGKGEPAPVSAMDNLARTHDYQYSQLMEKGVDPYFTYNRADEELVQKADLTTAQGWALYIGMTLKKVLPSDYTSVDPVPPFGAAEAGGGTGDTAPGEMPHQTSLRERMGEMKTNLLEKALAAYANGDQQMEEAMHNIAAPRGNQLEEAARLNFLRGGTGSAPAATAAAAPPTRAPAPARPGGAPPVGGATRPPLRPRRRRLEEEEEDIVDGGLNADARRGLSLLSSRYGLEEERSLRFLEPLAAAAAPPPPPPPRPSLARSSGRPPTAVSNPLAIMQRPVNRATGGYVPAPAFSRKSQGLTREVPSFVRR